MARFGVLVLAPIVLLAACGRTTDAPAADAAAPSPSTVSSHTSPQVNAFPAVTVERGDIGDAKPTVIGARSDPNVDVATPVITFTERLVFDPQFLDIASPRPIEFRNASDRAIEVEFRDGPWDPIALEPGESSELDPRGAATTTYQLVAVIGNAQTIAQVTLLEHADESTDDEVWERGTAVDAAHVLGIDMPAGEWRVTPFDRALVVTHVLDRVSQGDFQWALLTGAPLRSGGLRLELVAGVEQAELERLIESVPAPENCGDGERNEETIAGMAASLRVVDCDDADLVLGWLDAGAGDAVVFSAAGTRSQPIEQLMAALETLRVDGTGSIQADEEWENYVEGRRHRSWPPDPNPPLDLMEGQFGEFPHIQVDVLTGGNVELRNFDDVAHEIDVNHRPWLTVSSGETIGVDLDEFAADVVEISTGSTPFARLTVRFDVALRPVVEPALHVDTSQVALEVVELSLAERTGDEGGLVITRPERWTERLEPPDDSLVWAFSHAATYRRNASSNDPAEVSIGIWGSGIPPESARNNTSIAQRVQPDELEPFVTQRGLTWEIAQWSVPGGRYVTQAFVIEADDRLYASVRLTSAEGDHAALWANVVEPMLETLSIGAG